MKFSRFQWNFFGFRDSEASGTETRKLLGYTHIFAILLRFRSVFHNSFGIWRISPRFIPSIRNCHFIVNLRALIVQFQQNGPNYLKRGQVMGGNYRHYCELGEFAIRERT